MKTLSIVILSATFSLTGVVPSLSQDKGKQVQIKIIENGKVKTDTTFSVAESVDKDDIGRISEMLGNDDMFIYRQGPGKREFVYHYSTDSFPMNMDSAMANHFFKFKHDSVFDLMAKRFMGDSAFMFHDFIGHDEFFRDFSDDFDMMPPRHFHRGAPHPKDLIMEEERGMDIEKELGLSDDNETGEIDRDIIIHKKGPGKKEVIIEDESGPVKAIRKKIDDETEIIIIKKDSKKIKPEKDDSRKRDR